MLLPSLGAPSSSLAHASSQALGNMAPPPSRGSSSDNSSDYNRAYYRDAKKVNREIWRPGDGDGDASSEIFGGPITVRWRFFQSSLGTFVTGRNEPPKYVILDDQAAYDILHSGLYSREKLSRFWSHDFSVSFGNIRQARPNRGRAAQPMQSQGTKIDTHDGQGEREVGWALSGAVKKGIKYPFTGEKGGYTPVMYPAHTNRPTTTAEGVPLPVASSPARIAALESGRSASITPSIETAIRTDPFRVPNGHSRPKISKYLYRTPSPPIRSGSKRPSSAAFGGDNQNVDKPPKSSDSINSTQASRTAKRLRVLLPKPTKIMPDADFKKRRDLRTFIDVLEKGLSDVRVTLKKQDEEIARLRSDVAVLESKLIAQEHQSAVGGAGVVDSIETEH